MLGKKSIAISLITIPLLFSACGTSSSSSSTDNVTAISGQLVDGYVKGATYRCADGKTGETGLNGEFVCDTLPVEFTLGNIALGDVTTLPTDNHVFPQDLVGVDRNDTNNSEVLAISQFLQSLDSDGNPENGIDINTTSVENITYDEEFDAAHLDDYMSEANVTVVSQEQAREHLEKTLHTVEVIEEANLPAVVTDALNSVPSVLSDEVKNDLAYMGNEERLAYDVYNKLATLFPEQKPLVNIPTNSEIQHINSIKALVTKYDVNITDLSVVDINESRLNIDANLTEVAGVYNIQAVQDLYDSLTATGEASAVDALKVGCMVEVTDVDDLDVDIIDAEESNATDVVDVFNFLRDGSYSHYWAFDSALKGLGVTEGCCAAGDEYCKTELEYPKTENGNGGHGKGDGTGRGYHGGM